MPRSLIDTNIVFKTSQFWQHSAWLLFLSKKSNFWNLKATSSHQWCSVRKSVLRNFVKFTGKHLCQSLFYNKVAGLRPATSLNKRLWHRCFLVNFAKFLRTPTFFIEHLWWLLLKSSQLWQIYFLPHRNHYWIRIFFLENNYYPENVLGLYLFGVIKNQNLHIKQSNNIIFKPHE